MAAAPSTCVLSFFFVFALVLVNPTQAKPNCTQTQLTPDFYFNKCPQAFPIIRKIVWSALRREARMGASLLRLHFHDCFVNGCDGSILLDDTPTFTGEKTAFPNNNSVRGFEVVDQIKYALNKACGNVVSCADILAVAARDSVNLLGGPWYKVLVGRRDARTASWNDANMNLPPPFFNLTQLITSFQSHGLDLTDLVALSGGHTLGLAACTSFAARAYNDTNIDRKFAAQLQRKCPPTGGATITEPLDPSSNFFDSAYFKSLLGYKGLLHSDQALFKGDGSGTDKLVLRYARFPYLFFQDFSNSMIKMGNMKPLTIPNGEIRNNCRLIN